MRHFRFRLAAWLLLIGGIAAPTLRGEEPADEIVLNQFLGNYCLECHDTVLQKGERDFELFEFPLKNVADLIAAKEIVDQVTLKEMPPKKSEQPTDEERLAVVRVIRKSIDNARQRLESTGARTVIRRLSNREYENTLEVLFGRQIETLGLTADFPKEKTSRHIDTIGESLVTSGFLLDQYFQSAHRLVESRLGKPEMKPKSWHFTDNFKQYEELTGSHKSAFNFEFLCLYEQPNTDTRQGGYGHIEDFLEGVPVSGLYDIRVNVKAMHRFTHYDPKIFGIDFSEKFILGIVPGDATKGHIHYPQSIEPVLATAIVPDEKFEWITFRVWLDAGQTPRFIFPNGPYESRASVVNINKRYANEFKGVKSKSGVSRAHILKQGELPHIKIAEIKIDGPMPEKAGSKEEIAVFGAGGFDSEKALPQLFTFAERAYRRPLADADRKSIKKTFDLRISEQATPREAALDTLKMILCSPSFLYLSEITDEKTPMLGTYDLASRLSYALWASPPDDKLINAAASTEAALTNPQHLRAQGERLLADERVSGFVNGFLDSWLNLREIGQMPPPRSAARSYYAENLPESMKEETRQFFHFLLRENRSIVEFLDADYTFVDKKLAQLYQLPQKDALRQADGFRKVNIKSNNQRGGLLGMASVLTASANGVETSPVTRGVWVSENILGVSPPPPPDEVPAIDSDVRGAKTIRERLEKHRSQKTCAECHRKIDFLGFPLETFDPIGRWRSTYPKPKGDAPAQKVDPTGEFSSGEKFEDFNQFKKQIIATRKDAFTRHLISEFLTYACGRHMEAVDQFVIDDILAKVQQENYGLRTLILESLSSKIFRSR